MAEPSAFGGFWIRFVAYLVDSVILFTAFCLVAFVAVFAGLASGLGPEFASVIGLVCLIGPVLYWGLMQASARQATFGKALLGLKVTGRNGERLSPLRSIGRELAKIVSTIPMMLGFVLAAFTGRKQALHDMMASTVVVRESPGHLVVGLVVALFGWLAPGALVAFIGVGVLAAMMGSSAGLMQQAVQDAQKQPVAHSPPPAAPKVAPASPKPAPVAGAVKLLRLQLYQPEKETAARLGGDANGLARYAKAIEQRFVAVGASLKGTPRAFGVAVIVKENATARSWLIPGPGEDREVAALYRTLEADIAGLPAPDPKDGALGFALIFSVHGGQPERATAPPMPPSWVSITRSEQLGTFDELVQAVWPDPRAAAPVAKAAAQPVTVAAAPEPEAKGSEEPKPVVQVAKAEEAVVVPIPLEPVRPGPKYNDLMTAVLYADTGAVGQLIRLGRWVDKPDSRGTTPLTAAAMLGDVNSAELLLNAGANPAPALAVARERKDGSMTRLLQRYAK